MQHNPPANILMVDDRPENLLALEAILDPLQQNLIKAHSGQEALRHVLRHDFAVILLDVQMPGLDGFETATLIKEREKSRHIPIIFVTAISKDERYVFQGYEAGAVDYISKPFNPDILKSKVAVFVDLFKKTEQVQHQAHLLRESEQREKLREMAEQKHALERQHMAELAESQLRLSRFKETLDATLDGVFLFDSLTLRFSYINQGALEQLGYSHDEMMEMTPCEIEAQCDEEQFRARLAPLLEGRQASLTYQTKHKRRDDGLIPVETFLQYIAPPSSAPPEEPGGFVAIVRDITERQRAEAALRESEERFRLLMENVRDYAILVMDTEGRIINWSLGAQRIFGYEDGEALGREADFIFAPEDVENGVPEHEMQAAASEGRAVDERWHMRRDGSRFWASGIMTGLRDADGTLRGFAKVMRDSTERKRMEDSLILAKDEAERANHAKSEFIASVSHELRTPLNAIIGFSKLMLNPRVGPLNEDQDMYTRDIVQSAEHLLQLINDILDLSKIEAGKLDLELSAFSLVDLLDQSLIVVRENAKQHNLSLETHHTPEILALPEIIADQRKIKQIMYNLLSNAVKFTPDNGSITVRASLQGCTRADDDSDDASYDADAANGSKANSSKGAHNMNGVALSAGGSATDEGGPCIVISVQDTGIGIPVEAQQRVFWAFEQVDRSHTRHQQGTGLGLALTKRMVELHGGRIRLQSEVDKGSTFTFSIPLRTQTEENEDAASPTPQAAAPALDVAANQTNGAGGASETTAAPEVNGAAANGTAASGTTTNGSGATGSRRSAAKKAPREKSAKENTQ